jgi:hypothetical protein
MRANPDRRATSGSKAKPVEGRRAGSTNEDDWVHYASQTEAARKCGINVGSVSQCVRGKVSEFGGFHFRYATKDTDTAPGGSGAVIDGLADPGAIRDGNVGMAVGGLCPDKDCRVANALLLHVASCPSAIWWAQQDDRAAAAVAVNAAYDNSACFVCGSGEDEHLVLMCDGCPNEYHIGCLSPPLTALPKEDTWLCPQCSAGGG